MIDFSDLIGIPYAENGRDKNGVDCYGLALIVLRRMGKNLRDVSYSTHEPQLAQENAPTLNVRRIPHATAGALIEMNCKNELHIGVAINEKEMIHATRNQGVRISAISIYKPIAFYEVIE